MLCVEFFKPLCELHERPVPVRQSVLLIPPRFSESHAVHLEYRVITETRASAAIFRYLSSHFPCKNPRPLARAAVSDHALKGSSPFAIPVHKFKYPVIPE